LSEILDRIRTLVQSGDYRVSEHGYDELAEDGIFASDAIAGVEAAVIVEEYADAWKGPAILLLENDQNGRPIHAVWAIPKGRPGPAILVTAYRPDPTRWTDDFRSRKK